MTRRGPSLAACFAGMCLLLLAVSVRAGGVRADMQFAREGDGIVAAVTLRLPSGAHAYARESGDAGRPASLTFRLNGGDALPVWYPAGDMQRDYYDKNATVYVYDSGTTLFARLPGDGAGSPYAARLSLLVCTRHNCLPVDLPLKGAVPASLPDAARQPWHGEWVKLSASPPEEAGEAPARRFSLAGGGDRGGPVWTAVDPEVAGALPPSVAPLPPPPGEFDFQLAPRYSDEALEISHLCTYKYTQEYYMEEELFNVKSRFGEYPSYRVTKSGKVFSYRQGNILKPLSVVLDSSGYPIVKLYDDTNRVRTIAVHRLIADTFIPNPNNLECINHKDENKSNNSIDNLEWCTKAYNNCYNNKAVKIGLKLRESSPNKKAVNQIDENGVILNTFKSIREAARNLGNIRKDANIINGIRTHQKRYGYYWEYASV